jgi:hypothetical protein
MPKLNNKKPAGRSYDPPSPRPLARFLSNSVEELETDCSGSSGNYATSGTDAASSEEK